MVDIQARWRRGASAARRRTRWNRVITKCGLGWGGGVGAARDESGTVMPDAEGDALVEMVGGPFHGGMSGVGGYDCEGTKRHAKTAADNAPRIKLTPINRSAKEPYHIR